MVRRHHPCSRAPLATWNGRQLLMSGYQCFIRCFGTLFQVTPCDYRMIYGIAALVASRTKRKIRHGQCFARVNPELRLRRAGAQAPGPGGPASRGNAAAVSRPPPAAPWPGGWRRRRGPRPPAGCRAPPARPSWWTSWPGAGTGMPGTPFVPSAACVLTGSMVPSYRP